jgi:hypothetical protein
MADKTAPDVPPEPAETGRTTEDSQILDPNTATAEDATYAPPAPATAVRAPDDVEPEPEAPAPIPPPAPAVER